MKQKMAMACVCLAVIILAGCNTAKMVTSKPAVKIQESRVSYPTKQKECAAFFFRFQFKDYHSSYCSDINYCPEPCWPKERQLIIECLQIVGVEPTEEMIQVYLADYPSPEFFQEARKSCLTWGKAEKERQDCLHGYRSLCQ